MYTVNGWGTMTAKMTVAGTMAWAATIVHLPLVVESRLEIFSTLPFPRHHHRQGVNLTPNTYAQVEYEQGLDSQASFSNYLRKRWTPNNDDLLKHDAEHSNNEPVSADDQFIWKSRGQTLVKKSIKARTGISSFGRQLDVSSDGNWLVCGYIESQDSLAVGVGATAHALVYRFVQDLQTWVQVGEDIVTYLPMKNTNCTSSSMLSLSIAATYEQEPSGSGVLQPVVTIAIGLIQVESKPPISDDDDSVVAVGGQVRVFALSEYSSSNGAGVFWTVLGQELREMNGLSWKHGFGASVALSQDGRTLAVGIVYLSELMFPPHSRWLPGYVVTYHLEEDNNANNILPHLNWVQFGDTISGTGPLFGFHVSISADASVLAASMPAVVDNTDMDGNFSIAIPSSAWAYKLDPETKAWSPLGQDLVLETNQRMDIMLCNSMSMSSDGQTIVLGGRAQTNYHRQRDTPEPAGPKFLGHVRMYRYSDEKGNWTQMPMDLDHGQTDPKMGDAVAVSGNGTMVMYTGVMTKEEADKRNNGEDYGFFQAGPYVAVADLQEGATWKPVGVPLYGNYIGFHGNVFEWLAVSTTMSSNGCSIVAGFSGHGGQIVSWAQDCQTKEFTADTGMISIN